MTYVLCVDVVFMMHKFALVGVIVQLSTNEDDQLPKKVVLDGVNTKGS